MAQLIAPYNNSMRLGQGFNSYTHQNCLLNAVSIVSTDIYTPESGASASGQHDAHGEEHGEAAEKAQIVSYSTRFVEKISDVVNSMNISAALSINTNMIGGSANGSYIDSDKFKSSDINYFVQVRVSNQRVDGRAYSHLKLVNSVRNNQLDAHHEDDDGRHEADGKLSEVGSIDQNKFREVYGDSFISGWEEGGELNALISVKTKNKSKSTHIKAAIEGRLGTPALSGKVSGQINMETDDTFSESETTITVNWSGGGQIKEPNVLWDINSLTLAAAMFPYKAMHTPQRTYAILTKYTELPEFQNRIPHYSALDYDLAMTYTYALLDMYTDYKSIWKTLQIVSSDVEVRHTRLELAKPDHELKSYLDDYKPKALMSSDQIRAGASAQPTAVQNTVASRSTNANGLSFAPYPATLLGLQIAKAACRNQMMRIVKEVDNLKQNPSLALLPDTADVIPPSLFRQLLPVAIPVYETHTEEWIEPLGTSFPPEHQLSLANFEHFAEAKKSALKHSARAKHYRMSTWAGPSRPGIADKTEYKFVNDLDKLNNALIIDTIRVYYTPNGLTGILLFYTNRTRAVHGGTEGQIKEFHANGRTALGIQFAVNETKTIGDNPLLSIIHMAINWSDLRVESITCGKFKPTSRQVMFSSAPAMSDTKWDLAGFYSNYNKTADRLECVGLIWGNDIDRPAMSILPPHLDIETFPSKLKVLITEHMGRYDEWRLSDFAGNVDFSNEPEAKIDLGPTEIKPNMRLQSLEFWYNEFLGVCALCGMRQVWKNKKGDQQTLNVGKQDGKFLTFRWRNDANSAYRLVKVLIQTGRATKDSRTLEFVTEIGFTFLDEWTGKEYYITSYAPDAAKALSKPEPTSHSITATPPEAAGWSIRGFYSEAGDVIERLGVIWGLDAPF